MNYEAAILYAHQRMRELGKCIDQYHFEPVRISATRQEKISGTIKISAYNELYILVNPQNYFGVFISADNSTFNSDEARESGAPEFTGLIRITKINAKWNLDLGDSRAITLPVPIEFLRVVIN